LTLINVSCVTVHKLQSTVHPAGDLAAIRFPRDGVLCHGEFYHILVLFMWLCG